VDWQDAARLNVTLPLRLLLLLLLPQVLPRKVLLLRGELPPAPALDMEQLCCSAPNERFRALSSSLL